MWMTAEPTFWMPSAAATQAADVDWLYYFLYYVSLASFLVIMAALVYFVFKFRAKSRGERARSPGGHNTLLEVSWTIPPAIVSVIVFVMGAKAYIDMKSPPPDAVEIRVIGKSWNWEFYYPGSSQKETVLHVPPNRPVRLLMTSNDVLHSFFVPAFRIKQDVVPGRYTEVWFQATESGEHQIYCTEYCGTNHSAMVAKVKVYETETTYDEWLQGRRRIIDQGLPPEQAGEKLFAVNGCNGCHSVDGSAKVGPTLKGNWGVERVFTDGTKAVVDENYLRTSILNPTGQIVQGYPPVMPAFKGVLDDREIDALIAYMKTLKE